MRRLAERVAEKLTQRREQAAEATERADDADLRTVRTRRIAAAAVVGMATLALAGAVLAVVISIVASRAQAEDVARELSRPVTEQVIAESRTTRADTARRQLAEENARLAARGLPIVASPPPGALADDIVGAWITARVLGALPPTVTDQLAEQVADGRVPRVLPSISRTPDPDEAGDRVIEVIPDPGTPGSSDSGPRTATPPRGGGRPAPAPARIPTGARPAPPAPAPVPAPRGGGLLRPCVLGQLLC